MEEVNSDQPSTLKVYVSDDDVVIEDYVRNGDYGSIETSILKVFVKQAYEEIEQLKKVIKFTILL